MDLLAFLLMVGFDLLFLTVLLAAVVPLGMYRQTAFAVMKRNFAGYFINPTGYVFLALFMVLTSGFAFWPDGFFSSNLANFDQLSQMLPYVMLVIIPAITMSTWADEKRQGTDELLLTLPTTDLDIVMGKYIASVFIFTVALILSQLWNVFILIRLTEGELDVQLLGTTYLGYWFMGMAMLAIGMSASFLTNNLTVGFILGALFNAPLVLLDHVDSVVTRSDWSTVLGRWGLLERFAPFGRGLISLPSVVYFVGLAVIALYFCLILIGRRHWVGSKLGSIMSVNYLLRMIALVTTLVSLTFLCENTGLSRVRLDASEGGLSSLSRETIQLLDRLAAEPGREGEKPKPIRIEAFIAPEVPSEYAQTRSDLLNLLREFQALGGGRLQVVVHTNVEPFSELATVAEKRFGINPVTVMMRRRGTNREEEIILGAVFSCGLERVVVPFFEYGMPVEYELIRSINTVARTSRKKVGVVTTEAHVMGGDMLVTIPTESGSFEVRQVDPGREAFILELEKQYDVEVIDPSSPIDVWVTDGEGGDERLRYDAMLVFQPSSLGPLELDHLVTAIRQGQPTVVFEDPFWQSRNFVPGTTQEPLPDPRALLAGQASKPRRCDMSELWDTLHIRPVSKRNALGGLDAYIVWQAYNPYPQIDQFSAVPEYVFVRHVMGNVSPEDADAGTPWTGFPRDPEDPVLSLPTAGSEDGASLEEMLFPFPGAIRPAEGRTDLQFVPLVQTGYSGTISFNDRFLSGATSSNELALKRGTEQGYFVMAARIRGRAAPRVAAASTPGPEPAPGTPAPAADTSSERPIDVIYVADADCVSNSLILIRNQPQQGDATFRMQNQIFGLNVVDALAGELDYINIRSRGQVHRTLRAMEAEIDAKFRELRADAQAIDKGLQDQFEAEMNDLQQKLRTYQTQVQTLERKKVQGDDIDEYELIGRRSLVQQVEADIEQRRTSMQQRRNQERSQAIRDKRRETDLAIQRFQSFYKWLAVGIPWIPLVLVGMGVFAYRRLREREGISKNRLV